MSKPGNIKNRKQKRNCISFKPLSNTDAEVTLVKQKNGKVACKDRNKGEKIIQQRQRERGQMEQGEELRLE